MVPPHIPRGRGASVLILPVRAVRPGPAGSARAIGRRSMPFMRQPVTAVFRSSRRPATDPTAARALEGRDTRVQPVRKDGARPAAGPIAVPRAPTRRVAAGLVRPAGTVWPSPGGPACAAGTAAGRRSASPSGTTAIVGTIACSSGWPNAPMQPTQKVHATAGCRAVRHPRGAAAKFRKTGHVRPDPAGPVQVARSALVVRQPQAAAGPVGRPAPEPLSVAWSRPAHRYGKRGSWPVAKPLAMPMVSPPNPRWRAVAGSILLVGGA